MTHDDLPELIEIISESHDGLILEERQDVYDEDEKKALSEAARLLQKALFELEDAFGEK